MTAATTPKSVLEVLLEANRERDLSNDEFNSAWSLIHTPQFSPDPCWVCVGLRDRQGEETPKAIYDTGLCQSHAQYALITGK